MKNKYFTERERYRMETMLDLGLPLKEIAVELNKALSTIYLERSRGMVELLDSELRPYMKYCADVAQTRYEKKKLNKGIDFKIGNDHKLVSFIEDKIINEQYSPKAVLNYIDTHNLHFKTKICFKTLYNYIDCGLFLHLTNNHLPVKRTRRKREYRKVSVDVKNLKGLSIEERPTDVLERREYGHWEMDTVYSGKGKAKDCLLVLSERMTRQEKIIKMPDRTQKSVVHALNQLEKGLGFQRFSETFKTITVDNGVEFLDFKGIETSVYGSGKRTAVYYCHPFSSCERGTNENINRMIRRKIPKGDSIADYSEKFIHEVEEWINGYPRDVLGGLSAYQYLKRIMVESF